MSGQLRVAPEHVSDNVLKLMGKPGNDVYEKFVKECEHINEELGLKQYLVPYLMSSHPGSTLKDAIKLAEYVRDIGYMPEQVQDFYPTPSTIPNVCIIPELIQGRWSRCMLPEILTKRQCRGHLYNTKNHLTMNL